MRMWERTNLTFGLFDLLLCLPACLPACLWCACLLLIVTRSSVVEGHQLSFTVELWAGRCPDFFVGIPSHHNKRAQAAKSLALVTTRIGDSSTHSLPPLHHHIVERTLVIEESRRNREQEEQPQSKEVVEL
jgi:hypothetical protein